MKKEEQVKKQKSQLAKSLSALVLMSFAVIWLIYLCAGETMTERLAKNLSLAISVLSFITYIVKSVFAAGKSPRWLFLILLIATIGSFPATLLDVLQSCNIDLMQYLPVLETVFYVSHKISFIVLYAMLMISAWGLTDSAIFRLIFIAIGAFLIFCVVAEWLPFAVNFPAPLIGFNGSV